jgi:hypothetical protein
MLRGSAHVGTARYPMSDRKLLELPRRAQENNALHGLAIRLPYVSGNYIHLLEGEAEIIGVLGAKILCVAVMPHRFS